MAFFDCVDEDMAKFAVFDDYVVLLCKFAYFGEQSAGINDVYGEYSEIKTYRKRKSEVF